ncbi:MAG: DegV family protein, partial [Oscillospiraceae bacterium]
FPDGRELGFPEFYDCLRAQETATTAAVNGFEFAEAFEPILAAGQDVLYLGFSSGLSSTYAASRIAADELCERYPGRRILCIDTLAASMGEGLLVYHAALRRAAGGSLDETAGWVTDNRLRLCHWFTVDDLHHLRRGGRLGALAAYAGTVLGIKPVLHVDDEGRLIPMAKARGHRLSLRALADKMTEAEEPSRQMIFISHADAPAAAQELAEMLQKRFGIETIETNFIGPVIGAHTGPGTVALFFLGSHR